MILNDDLVEKICFHSDKPTVAALCAGSRALSVASTSELYRSIDLHELSTPSVFRLFATIESSRSLASLVRALLNVDVLLGLTDPTAYAAALTSALLRMPNLRTLSCYSLQPLVSHYPLFAGAFPALRSLRDATFVGSDWSEQAQTQVFVALPPLSRLVFQVSGNLLEERWEPPTLQAARVPGLESLLRTSCESLERLELHGLRLSYLLNGPPFVVFRRLVILTIRSEEPLEDVWACAFPNLERLTMLNHCDDRLALISFPGSLPRLSYLGFCFEGFERPGHPERAKPLLARRIGMVVSCGQKGPNCVGA